MDKRIREIADTLVKAGITMGHPINREIIPRVSAGVEELTSELVALFAQAPKPTAAKVKARKDARKAFALFSPKELREYVKRERGHLADFKRDQRNAAGGIWQCEINIEEAEKALAARAEAQRKDNT